MQQDGSVHVRRLGIVAGSGDSTAERGISAASLNEDARTALAAAVIFRAAFSVADFFQHGEIWRRSTTTVDWLP